jgi:hypothetical protein
MNAIVHASPVEHCSRCEKAASPPTIAVLLAVATGALVPTGSLADEGGVSFWLPGMFGSLAAVPQQQPGWALATVYYHTTVSAGGDLSLAREFTIRKIPANLTASLNANLNATGDLALVVPSYAFATPVLGGQAAVSMAGIYGRTSASVAGTLSGTLATPLGSIAFMRSDSIGDSVTGFGDLYPQATLKWNQGVYNFMTYVTGGIPIGNYDATRLANIGLGHGAIDAGGGYTYFNPQTGRELSAVGGFTYNFVNSATNYQNGVDFHLDMAAAQFLSKQVFVGAVGYIYNQLAADRGSAPILGPIESRVAGVGPQLGYLFPIGNMQGALNLKAYFEFDKHDRPSGWNTWVAFSISPAAPPAPTAPRARSAMIHK